MHRFIKILLLLQISILPVFISQYSFAQFVGSRALNNLVNQQSMNFQNRMMMNNSLIFNDALINKKYDFIVVFADGTKKTVHSKIYLDTVVHKNYLLFEDKSLAKSDTNRKRKIYPNQTQSISRDIAEYWSDMDKDNHPPAVPTYFFGFPKDTCWMFKVITGPINVYSYLSETTNVAVGHFTPQTIIGIQHNDGPIVAPTNDNLKEMVLKDPESMKYLSKKYFLTAIAQFNNDQEKASKYKSPFPGICQCYNLAISSCSFKAVILLVLL